MKILNLIQSTLEFVLLQRVNWAMNMQTFESVDWALCFSVVLQHPVLLLLFRRPTNRSCILFLFILESDKWSDVKWSEVKWREGKRMEGMGRELKWGEDRLSAVKGRELRWGSMCSVIKGSEVKWGVVRGEMCETEFCIVWFTHC